MNKPLILAITVAFTGAIHGSATQSSAQDVVYRYRANKNPARVRGTIDTVSPQEVTISTDDGSKKTVPASEVVRIVLEDQPTKLTRARERFNDGRFEDCLQELDKVEDDPAGKNWQAEADYLRAAVGAELSRAGGQVSAQAAGQAVNRFLKTHPKSYLKFPATEQLAKLLFAFGRMKNASQTFTELTESGWPQYQHSGPYWQGLAEREQGNNELASRLFQKSAAASNGPDAETWRWMAKCQVARCEGVAGNADAAISSLQKIIKEQNADNARLFATAFNSLGSIYLAKNKLKEARTEFLKTELLYPTATNEHAEAMYHLSKIWIQLSESDRATRTREALKSRYGNSWWATRD